MLMGSIPVKVTPHRTLNSRKFVIKELLLLNGSLCASAYML